uniref:Transmembrane protein n=1 Tax=Globodera pallida TaxID=36090 RepID=A0A183C7Q4_GLOPA
MDGHFSAILAHNPACLNAKGSDRQPGPIIPFRKRFSHSPLMNSTVANYSNVEQLVLLSLNVVEFVSHIFLDCPFAALNFYLIFTTSILHPNLKFILLCQSGCIFIRGIVRLEIILGNFLMGQFCHLVLRCDHSDVDKSVLYITNN